MKELFVPMVNIQPVDAGEVPAVLDGAGVAWLLIGEVDWPLQYPYCPRAEFRIAHTAGGILLHYRVREHSVAAMAGRDNGNVWEDSCVEFFSMPADDGIYYNIECNCAGTVLVGAGRDRSCRELAPQRVLNGVRRWTSMGREPFAERIGEAAWEVALVIPYSTYFLHSIASLGGQAVPANFYKCGDRLQRPHFLSWNPVTAPSPDFHRPECFGRLLFNK